jgi:tRNA 2-thiouridine synthesizing protein E
MALQLKIPHGLIKEHWDVIHSIRNTFQEMGRCPLVYEICRMNGLRIQDLRKLFPTGFLRGACKLAGITSREGHLGPAYDPISLPDITSFMESYDKTYEVDVRGFLVNPDQWDEYYAVYKAYDPKLCSTRLAGAAVTRIDLNVLRLVCMHPLSGDSDREMANNRAPNHATC